MAQDGLSIEGIRIRLHIRLHRPLSPRDQGDPPMIFHLSTTNFWTLVVGLALAAVNIVASSRLAPHLASLFGRSR
jgi:hypothetical protein